MILLSLKGAPVSSWVVSRRDYGRKRGVGQGERGERSVGRVEAEVLEELVEGVLDGFSVRPVVGGVIEGDTEVSGGLFGLFCGDPHGGPLEVGGGVVGIDGDGGLPVLDGAVEVADEHAGGAAVGEGLDVVGSEFEGLVVVVDGPLEVLGEEAGVGAVVVVVRVAGAEAHGHAEVGGGFLGVFEVEVEVSAGGVDVGEVGLDADHALVVVEGGAEVAHDAVEVAPLEEGGQEGVVEVDGAVEVPKGAGEVVLGEASDGAVGPDLGVVVDGGEGLVVVVEGGVDATEGVEGEGAVETSDEVGVVELEGAIEVFECAGEVFEGGAEDAPFDEDLDVVGVGLKVVVEEGFGAGGVTGVSGGAGVLKSGGGVGVSEGLGLEGAGLYVGVEAVGEILEDVAGEGKEVVVVIFEVGAEVCEGLLRGGRSAVGGEGVGDGESFLEPGGLGLGGGVLEGGELVEEVFEGAVLADDQVEVHGGDDQVGGVESRGAEEEESREVCDEGSGGVLEALGRGALADGGLDGGGQGAVGQSLLFLKGCEASSEISEHVFHGISW